MNKEAKVRTKRTMDNVNTMVKAIRREKISLVLTEKSNVRYTLSLLKKVPKRGELILISDIANVRDAEALVMDPNNAYVLTTDIIRSIGMKVRSVLVDKALMSGAVYLELSEVDTVTEEDLNEFSQLAVINTWVHEGKTTLEIVEFTNN